MATRNFAKLAFLIVAAVCCSKKETLEQSQAPTTSEPVVSSAIIPGEATIQFTEEMTALIEEGLQLDGVLSMERVFPDAGPYEGRTRRAGLNRFYKVVYSQDVPFTKAQADLSELPGIVSVTPHYLIQKRTAFNDPWFSYQWHYVDDGKADINVKGVWDRYTTGSNKVVVAVVDEPVDASHPDLQGNIWYDEAGHTGYNFARNSWDMTIRPEPGRIDGQWCFGDTGHGTHVAGTIAAVNNNGTGLCGVAGGDYAHGVPGVKIMSSVIYSGYDQVATNPETAAAIKWAADHGAVISQNSWGFVYNEDVDMATYMSYNIENYCPEIKAAVDYFIRYAGCDDDGNQLPDSPMKGGLVIFAAGNDGVQWDIISSYEPIISVGAHNRSLNRASYSNYGSWVDISAPGGAGYEGDSIWSTLPQKVNDGFSPNGGLVIDSHYYGGVGWAGTSMACPHVSGVAALIISYFGGPGFTADMAKDILFKGLGATVGGYKPCGKKLDALASFQYGVEHYPVGGQSSDPQPPVLEVDQKQLSVKAHQTAYVYYKTSDPNGDAVTVSLTPGSKAVTLDREGGRLVIDGWKDKDGTYQAKLVASDGVFSTAVSITYTLLPNHAPVVQESVSDILMSGLQNVVSLPLSSLFYDADEEPLSIWAERGASENCILVSVDEDRILIKPNGYGTATVNVTATDFMGEDAALSFRVAVVDPHQPVRVTPEVASTESFIYIETETAVTVNLSLYASTGGLVYHTQTSASVFEPIKLDVSALAPGRYTAVLDYNDSTRRVRVIKY